MKITLNNRNGQISLGLVAIVVGGILVSVMAGIAIKGGVTAIEKSKKAQQESAGCSSLNPEQCAADELKKNQEAGIVSPGEQLKDAVISPITDLGCDPKGDEIVYINCLNNQKALELDKPAEPEAVKPACDAGDVDCQLQREARSTGGFLDSQKELGSNWIYGPMYFMEAIYNSVKSAVSNFWNPRPAPIAPIDLGSVPDAKTCTPSTSCISFCKYGGDLQNCRTTNADCTVTLSTKGKSCLPAPVSGGGSSAPTPKPPVTCVPYDPYGDKNISANLAKVNTVCGIWNPYENKSTVAGITSQAQYDACVKKFWASEEAKTVECP